MDTRRRWQLIQQLFDVRTLASTIGGDPGEKVPTWQTLGAAGCHIGTRSTSPAQTSHDDTPETPDRVQIEKQNRIGRRKPYVHCAAIVTVDEPALSGDHLCLESNTGFAFRHHPPRLPVFSIEVDGRQLENDPQLPRQRRLSGPA